jgi:hypothetical protein
VKSSPSVGSWGTNASSSKPASPFVRVSVESEGAAVLNISASGKTKRYGIHYVDEVLTN